jgi:hypothetical protein
LRLRPHSRPHSRGLSRPLGGAADGPVTKVIIDLSPTSNSFYSLGSDWVVSGYFKIDIYVLSSVGTSGFVKLVDAAGSLSRLDLNYRPESGSFDNRNYGHYTIDGVLTNLMPSDGELHHVIFERDATDSDQSTKELNRMGCNSSSSGSFWKGILSTPKLTDITTPANSFKFELNELTANTETNNGVTLTYQNIPASARDTYTLTPAGNYLGSELVVNGNFANGSTNWRLRTDSSVVNGKVVVDGGDNAQGGMFQEAFLTAGYKYQYKFGVPSYTSGVITLVDVVGSPQFSSSGSFTFVGVQSNSNLAFFTSNPSFLEMDNVSAKRLIEVA